MPRIVQPDFCANTEAAHSGPPVAVWAIAGLCASALAWVSGEDAPRWVFMWLLAMSIFAAAKWLTWSRVRFARMDRWRSYGYLLAWPGMDAEAFLNSRMTVVRPEPWRWLPPTIKLVTGAILLWCVARLVPNRLAAGWIGMVGLIGVLHFGVFHLLALGWQSIGVAAQPLMDAPLRACSLADFWSRRWNTAFNELAWSFIFRPLVRRAGVVPATVAAFGASGVVHDLVISLPASAGFGLPTLYFLGQGMALLFERSRAGRRLGLGRGIRGWLFTLLVAGGPAFWLFHPPFVERVIIPFLEAIGAL